MQILINKIGDVIAARLWLSVNRPIFWISFRLYQEQKSIIKLRKSWAHYYKVQFNYEQALLWLYTYIGDKSALKCHWLIHTYYISHMGSVVVFLKFWAHEILQNFGETFGETFGEFWESFVAPSSPPPPPPKIHMWEIVYTALCKIYFLTKLW